MIQSLCQRLIQNISSPVADDPKQPDGGCAVYSPWQRLYVLGGRVCSRIPPDLCALLKTPLTSEFESGFDATYIIRPVWLLPPCIFDMVVFALTVMKTCEVSKAQRAIGMKSKLASLLLRDGQWFHEVSLNEPSYDLVFLRKYVFCVSDVSCPFRTALNPPFKPVKEWWPPPICSTLSS